MGFVCFVNFLKTYPWLWPAALQTRLVCNSEICPALALGTGLKGAPPTLARGEPLTEVCEGRRLQETGVVTEQDQDRDAQHLSVFQVKPFLLRAAPATSTN